MNRAKSLSKPHRSSKIECHLSGPAQTGEEAESIEELLPVALGIEATH